MRCLLLGICLIGHEPRPLHPIYDCNGLTPPLVHPERCIAWGKAIRDRAQQQKLIIQQGREFEQMRKELYDYQKIK